MNLHAKLSFDTAHALGDTVSLQPRVREQGKAKVDDALESETFPPAVIQKQTGKGSRSAPEHDHQCPHD